MYTVAKAPIKIVTKTRRGINQNIDTLRDTKRSHDENGDFSNCDPKPYFQPTNGKRSHTPKINPQEAISPQHEELIKYICESWSSVCQEDKEGNSEEKKGASKVCFHLAEPSSELKDFTPFDLESWWEKRLFNTITKSIP